MPRIPGNHVLRIAAYSVGPGAALQTSTPVSSNAVSTFHVSRSVLKRYPFEDRQVGTLWSKHCRCVPGVLYLIAIERSRARLALGTHLRVPISSRQHARPIPCRRWRRIRSFEAHQMVFSAEVTFRQHPWAVCAVVENWLICQCTSVF